MTARLTRSLAAAVHLSRRTSVALAGIAFAAGSLVALVLSRTVGVFGFTETIWTSQALKTLASELGVIVALACALNLQRRPRLAVIRTTRVP
jgi:hypothetical protein